MGDKKKGFFSRLVEGLTKTRDSIVGGIDSVFSGFPRSMMISMRRSKRRLSWAI